MNREYTVAVMDNYVLITRNVTEEEWRTFYTPPEALRIAAGLGFFRSGGLSGSNYVMTWRFNR